MSPLPIARQLFVSLLSCLFVVLQEIDHQPGVIEYLRRFGYSDYQVYLLLSCAPVQGHVAGIVDIPKFVTPLFFALVSLLTII